MTRGASWTTLALKQSGNLTGRLFIFIQHHLFITCYRFQMSSNSSSSSSGSWRSPAAEQRSRKPPVMSQPIIKSSLQGIIRTFVWKMPDKRWNEAHRAFAAPCTISPDTDPRSALWIALQESRFLPDTQAFTGTAALFNALVSIWRGALWFRPAHNRCNRSHVSHVGLFPVLISYKKKVNQSSQTVHLQKTDHMNRDYWYLLYDFNLLLSGHVLAHGLI